MSDNRIYLNNNLGKVWNKYHHGYVKGFAYELDGSLLEEEKFYLKILSNFKQNTLTSFLSSLNGNFSAVLECESKLLLVVDHIRSYPLFYSVQNDNHIIVTDIGRDMVQCVNKRLINDEAAYELLSLGYLSGEHTIIQNIKNVIAGSFVIIESGEAIINNYYSYVNQNKGFNMDGFREHAMNILDSAFERILKTIAGHPILIPLSGGYDSRLIACLCKKFELNDVTCFTYGRKDSFEVITSKKVANQLGFEWHFIEYNYNIWKRFIESDIFRNYCLFAGNLTANPHFQDFLALEELNNLGILKPGMVVIPGHSGDLLGGSKIPTIFLENKNITFNSSSVSNLIFNEFYNLNVPIASWKERLIRRTESNIGTKEYLGVDDFLDDFECWFIKSKVANFLVNSMRGYEYWGLDWRLPLWDVEYEKLWYSIHWQHKYYSTFYDGFMFDSYFKKYSVDYYKNKGITNSSTANHIKRLLPSGVNEIFRKILHELRGLKSTKNINAFDDVSKILCDHITTSEYDGIKQKKLTNINAVLAYYYLNLQKLSYK